MEHGKQPQIRLEDIKSLHVQMPAVKVQKPFIEKVEQILEAKKCNEEADTSSLERDIDELVYNLYGLTPVEKNVLEESTNQ